MASAARHSSRPRLGGLTFLPARWDYGRLELYMTNSLFVTDGSASAAALRAFLRLDAPGTPGDGRQQLSTLAPGVEVDSSSVVLNSKVNAGKIGPKCVLVNVHAPSVDVEGCGAPEGGSNPRLAEQRGTALLTRSGRVTGQYSST